MRMTPASAVSSPAISRSVVDLPHPDGPSSTLSVPGSKRERHVVDGAHLAAGGRPVLADVVEGDRGHAFLPCAGTTRMRRRGSAEQRGQRRAGIGRAHERLADQERVHAVPAHARDVALRDDAALGDDQPVGRHARQQVERRVAATRLKLRRLRLLMPMSGVGSAQRALELGARRAPRPARPCRVARAAPRAPPAARRRARATMSRMQSAPSARDSATWYASTMKSLRSTGSAHAARAATRSSAAPWKNSRVGQHRQARRAVRARSDAAMAARVEVCAQHALARARLLDLGDDRRLARRDLRAQRRRRSRAAAASRAPRASTSASGRATCAASTSLRLRRR